MAGNQRGSASRAALLAAGRTAFSQRRYEEVSIVEVARSVGAAAGSINYHFGDKRAFYLAVLEQVAEEFWAELVQMRGPGAQRLVRGVDVLLDWAEGQPQTFEALITDVGDRQVRTIHDRHRSQLVTALALEITGSESTPVLRTALHGCLSSNEAMVLQWLHTPQISRDQLRDLMIASVYSAVLSAVGVDPDIELSPRAIEAMLAGWRAQDIAEAFTLGANKGNGL